MKFGIQISHEYLGLVLFWVWLQHFWQSFAPWIYYFLRKHSTNWNLAYRFIREYLGQALIWAQSHHFWQSYAFLDLKKFPFAISVHFLCRGCTYWDEIWFTYLSDKYLGQVLFLVQSQHFWQSYAFLDLEKFQFKGHKCFANISCYFKFYVVNFL